nr:LytTR family DNA-binding domain-containing protein [Lysobacter ciconiae]
MRLLDGRSELRDKSLAALTAVLPPDFVRCHRSCLVNLRHNRSLHSGSGSRYWLVMANGKELQVGRTYISGLRRELGID